MVFSSLMASNKPFFTSETPPGAERGVVEPFALCSYSFPIIAQGHRPSPRHRLKLAYSLEYLGKHPAGHAHEELRGRSSKHITRSKIPAMHH
jgi:hypothetical protein